MANEIKSDNGNLTLEQLSAIKRKIELGLILQKELPQIAGDYKDRFTHEEITEVYDISKTYRVTEEIARGAVSYAIRGYNKKINKINIPTYIGLIKDLTELDEIAEAHLIENGKITGLALKLAGKGIHAQTLQERMENGCIGGQITYQEKLGIYGRTSEQHSLDSQKAGLFIVEKYKAEGKGIFDINAGYQRMGGLVSGQKLGTKMRDEKRGIHAMTSEELSAAAKKGAAKALEACGFIAWSDEEIKEAKELRNKGLEALEIADRINKKFHDNKKIRNRNGVYSILRRK